ncbi:MAG: endolytic transglycosylase MltG [Rhizobiales bacterium]|nr:endolytic transglycosylase MltG [Hyphomicrobiales bacterium]
MTRFASRSSGVAPPRPDSPRGVGALEHGILPRSPAEVLEPTRPPEPPRRRSRRQRGRRAGGFIGFLGGSLTFLLMALISIGVAQQVVKYQFNKPGPLPHSTVVVIPKGDGVNAIADRLQREGVLRDKWLFTLGVIRFRAQRKLRAGEYEFPQAASVRQVLDTLVEGKAILHKVAVPEGRTSYEVVEILNQEPLLKGEITEIPAEGTLLPDTYRFSRGTPRQELLGRMVSEQTDFLQRAWAKRQEGLPLRSPEEALVLASIVEKETGRADERRRVAGVFVNRLRQGMRLQSDPTIIYGITLGRGGLGRGIRRSEIDKPTPYNTYQIDGLPPTPICNPGREAIEAVLNPEATDDLFFVADGTGGHAFARTLAEHNRNVERWRQIERQQRATPAVVTGNASVTTPASSEGQQPAVVSASDGDAFPVPVRKPARQ